MSKITRLKPLPDDELKAILRAADDIIASGGRTLLSQILKGSKIRKLLELKLDQNPSYGYFSIDYIKVKEEIRRVIQGLNEKDRMTDSEWKQILTERAHSLLIGSHKPIFLLCQSCKTVFLFNDTNPDYYMNSGLNLPTECVDCYGDDNDD